MKEVGEDPPLPSKVEDMRPSATHFQFYGFGKYIDVVEGHSLTGTVNVHPQGKEKGVSFLDNTFSYHRFLSSLVDFNDNFPADY